MTETEELIEQYIVISTLHTALMRDSRESDKLVRVFSNELIDLVAADLKTVRQQMWKHQVTVKKYEGKPKYEATVSGKRMVVEYTPQELKRLCEDKASSYIEKGGP